MWYMKSKVFTKTYVHASLVFRHYLATLYKETELKP